MIYLPDDLSKRLKHLAVERETSVAELIRQAVATLLDDKGADMKAVRKVMAEYGTDPSSATPIGSYRKARK